MQSQRDWQFRCPKCDLYHSTLVPGPGTGIEGLEDLRRANFELMLDRAEKARSLSGLRLLEVGSAKGWFLEAATRRGMVAHGLEPEEANVRIARSNGLSAELGFFPADLQDHGPYDVIAFNDVFEHLPSPVLAIRRVEELLSVDGTVVINLPSSEGALFRIATLLAAMGFTSPLERLWQMGFPSPHIWYFSPKNLALLVSRHTELTLDDAFPLPSVTRSGLYDRIRSSHAGPLGHVLFAAVWLLSFVLPLLPADIHVAMFRKGARRSSGVREELGRG